VAEVVERKHLMQPAGGREVELWGRERRNVGDSRGRQGLV